MNYAQVKKPDLSIKGVAGWCLNYARRVYHVGPKYTYAWTAWQHSIQHRNRDLPKRVSVPVWFSYKKAGINMGHVAVYVPGKGVYSSPIAGKTHFSSIADLERWASNINYVGWSEDINGVRVVKRVANPAPAPKPEYVLVKSGEGLSHIAKRVGYKDWKLASRWQKITDLNKKGWHWSKYNDSLKPGQRVRVK